MKKLTAILFVLLLISSCSYTKRQLGVGQEGKQAHGLYARQQPVDNPVYAEDTPQKVPPRFRIAMLLPLSGKSANIGKSMADAGKLAADESGRHDFELLTFDTGDTVEQTAEATEKAIAAGASIILGPVFSDKVTKVATRARESNLKVIAFSNNKAVAGRNVYILGLIPDQQVTRVIQYSVDRGITGYSAVVPNNVFGNQVAELTEKQVSWKGGEIRKISLVAGGDYAASAKEIADAYQSKSLVPDRKSEAVLIPEGGAKAAGIASALKKAGVGNVRLLGTALWDNESTIPNKALSGGWFAGTPYETSDLFVGRFMTRYHYKPEDIAGLGYDAVNLAISVADEDFSDSAIRRSRGFDGVKGIYKFDGYNVNQRGLAVYELRNGAAHVVDPAPDHF